MDRDGIWDDDIVFYDYISDRGLIKRSILFKDLKLTSPDKPEPKAVFDAQDESVLTNVNF